VLTNVLSLYLGTWDAFMYPTLLDVPIRKISLRVLLYDDMMEEINTAGTLLRTAASRDTNCRKG
jgi:hypothetical protein